MNEIIKVNEENMTVSARDLHEKLGVGTRFNDWFPRMCEYGFSEGTDFYSNLSKTCETQGRPAVDYEISIDMAKQICMIQRTEIGKKIRQYFIDLEKAWNTPEQVMARALKIADQTIAGLKKANNKLSGEVLSLSAKVDEMKPKVSYYDNILNSPETVLTTQIAKDYGMSAKEFNKLLKDLNVQYKVNGQWVLYAGYQGQGYTHSRTYSYDKYNGDTGSRMQTEWRQKGRLFLYDLLKQHGILPQIEREE